MSSKSGENKEIRENIQKYLADPSSENAKAIIALQYHSQLAGMLPKLGRSKAANAVALLVRDDSQAAIALLENFSGDASMDIAVRIDAVTELEKRGKSAPGKNILIELKRIADEDDFSKAAQSAGSIDDAQFEAWTKYLVVKKAVKSIHALGASMADRHRLKILKRAAYELRGGGFAVEDWDEKGESILKSGEKFEPAAFATGFDGYGSRFLFAAIENEFGSPFMVLAKISEENGFDQFYASKIALGKVKATLDKIRHDQLEEYVPAPVGYFREIMKNAAEKMLQKKGTVPADYMPTMQLLMRLDRDYSPVDIMKSLDGEVGAKDLRESGGLFDLKMFTIWEADVANLESCSLKLNEALTSELVISDAQRREQVEKAFQDSAKKMLTPEIRAAYSERLTETARLLIYRGDKINARRAIAVAQKIIEPESAPEFVVQMFRKTFKKVYEELDKIAAAGAAGGKPGGGTSGGIVIP